MCYEGNILEAFDGMRGVIYCICGASDDKLNNFSDTSYESCTAAPDSNSDLRLTSTTSCVLVQHVLDIVLVILIPNIPLPLSDDQEGSEEILKDL